MWKVCFGNQILFSAFDVVLARNDQPSWPTEFRLKKPLPLGMDDPQFDT